MPVIKPFDFKAGNPANGEEVNENFDVLYTLLNGGLKDEHVAADACIDWSKICKPSVGDGVAFLVGYASDGDLPVSVPADSLSSVMYVYMSCGVEIERSAATTTEVTVTVHLQIDDDSISPVNITSHVIEVETTEDEHLRGNFSVIIKIPALVGGPTAGGASPVFDPARPITLDIVASQTGGGSTVTFTDKILMVWGA